MDDDQPNRVRSDARIKKVGAYFAAVFLGGVVGLVISMLIIRMLGPGSLPEMTEADYQSAVEKWNDAAILDYDMEVTVEGHERSLYRVEVRNGTVRAAWRNGQPLKQQRILGTWSVPGMWETIARDVSIVRSQQQNKLEPGQPQLNLRAVFDAQLGYPRRYQRTEIRRFQPNQESSWEVIQFRRSPLDGDPSSSNESLNESG